MSGSADWRLSNEYDRNYVFRLLMDTADRLERAQRADAPLVIEKGRPATERAKACRAAIRLLSDDLK